MTQTLASMVGFVGLRMTKACPPVFAHRVRRFVCTNSPCHPMLYVRIYVHIR